MTLAERCQQVMPPMALRVTDLGVTKGSGAYLYTDDGRKILDFASGIAVCNLGHNHPRVVEAAKKQMDSLIHGCHNIVYYEPYVKLAEELVARTGGNKMLYFSNSGAEANEGALKLAKYHTHRPAIISFTNSFHGRTIACASITGSAAGYRKYYEPLLPSVYFAEYPNLFRTPYKMVDGKCPKEYMDQFDVMFHKLVDPSMVAAIVLEPIQGEGGYIVPPVEWLQHVRKVCDEHGIMMIFDEVQTGFGRTGELYAFQTLGVEPDIFTTAKALGSGFPISAVVGKKEVMESWARGAHGGTFGGNPVSCAASLATLEVMDEENLLDYCKKTGQYFRDELSKLQTEFSDRIGDVRGVGMMNAIEFVGADNGPDAAFAAEVSKKALAENLLLLTCGVDKNIVRFIPPINVKKEEIDEAIGILRKVMK